MPATTGNRTSAGSPAGVEVGVVAVGSRPEETAASPPITRRAFFVYLVRATFALALGVALLLSGSGLSNLASFIAVYWILGAVITLRWVAVHREAGERRIGFVAGGTALAAGIALALRNPLQNLFSQAVLLESRWVSSAYREGCTTINSVRMTRVIGTGSSRDSSTSSLAWCS